MNFYDFINSQAVGSYCQEKGHAFTPIQAAYLVNSSHRHTLKEKHQAFCYIMEHMPDEETNARVRHTADGAVHRAGIRWLLSRYMEIQNRYLEEFFKNGEGEVYEYRVCCSWDYYDEDKYYPTIQSVFAEMDQELSSEEDMVLIQVCKSKTDGSGQTIRVTFSKEKEVTDIDIGWDVSEEEQDILYGINGVCFVCPVPFKKGDIVYAPFQSGTYTPRADQEPFIFDYVWYEGEEKIKRNRERMNITKEGLTLAGLMEE